MHGGVHRNGRGCSTRRRSQHVVPVSSTQVAEMVKLLENTFRMINIGLVNEMALMCDRMGINVWEVIDAAATKPFGFMPFYPGPGLGGHCIPIDPFYLSWKTKQAGIEARFIELAGYINGQMPHFVVDKVQNALNDAAKPVKGSHIHVMGVAYKRDIDDMRESPALDIMLLLEKRGAQDDVQRSARSEAAAGRIEPGGTAGDRGGGGGLRRDRDGPFGVRLYSAGGAIGADCGYAECAAGRGVGKDREVVRGAGENFASEWLPTPQARVLRHNSTNYLERVAEATCCGSVCIASTVFPPSTRMPRSFIVPNSI